MQSQCAARHTYSSHLYQHTQAGPSSMLCDLAVHIVLWLTEHRTNPITNQPSSHLRPYTRAGPSQPVVLTYIHALGQVPPELLAAAVLVDLTTHGVQLPPSAAQLHVELRRGADVGHTHLLTVACTPHLSCEHISSLWPACHIYHVNTHPHCSLHPHISHVNTHPHCGLHPTFIM